MAQFPFEWWVTLTFKNPIKNEYPKNKLKLWSRNLIKEEQIQIAYFCVINEMNRIHLHLLALGRNKHGKTLLDVSPAKWAKAWKDQCRINPIYDVKGVCSYFEKNTILWDDILSEVILYNKKLLKKVQLMEGPKTRDNTALDMNNIFISSAIGKEKGAIQSRMVELINSFKN